jgi:type I restriction enzyme, S subunit
LIGKKQRQIELLAEKRAALISHAVTKGLDPNAPMKDPGIDWIGNVPEHWSVKRLKHISPRQTVGVVVNPSSYVDDQGDVPFFLGTDVTEGHIESTKARRIARESNVALAKSVLRAGDLITVRVGYPGITAVVPPHLDGSNCASMMIVRRSPKFVSQWLCYAMNSRIGKAQVEVVQYGAAQKQFNISHAVEFRFPVPPRGEQNDIARVLDQDAGKVASASNKISESISKLREYRTALISAAVTGKIDVREEVA